MKRPKFSDPAAIVVIVLTVALFALALFLKGFTRELLLEAGIFLVSAKLILMAKNHADTEKRVEQQLAEIKSLLESLTQRSEALVLLPVSVSGEPLPRATPAVRPQCD